MQESAAEGGRGNLRPGATGPEGETLIVQRLHRLLPAFKGRLHDKRTATVVGRWLGGAVLVCFVTGTVSHYVQHPSSWLIDILPSRPSWGYRLNQGLHVASGIAAIPLLFAKLWTVFPRLFEWPAVRNVWHGLERISVAALVATGVFQLFTGLLNTAQWYPWPFSFVPVHFAVSWLFIGALLLHIAVKLPVISSHWRRESAATLEIGDGADRRSFLYGVAVAVGAVTLTTAGQSFTPLRSLDLFAPRHPNYGPQGLPVNKTAVAAGADQVDLATWKLEVGGPQPFTLSLDELRALPQYEAELPIACVEGWSKSAKWRGVRVRDLLEQAGAPASSRVRVTSFQRGGAYRVMEMGRNYAEDPLTLLALELNGEPLHPDHGFPARIIAPNRPGVWQTKWVAKVEAL
ncbi:molybdopterin-dependent oxidoreductase [Streptomyces sp. TRM66268-LWL]|uniref:Molybdopterin-dependent oxidoreductase n=2 Tax=Streptomyces polyasparticus TaxID=2767826 RepID=A0ABR7SVE6_9ACTN|nr:molybdopterin-dependent oxidoreductase [Streptomyces polyasparticus]